MVRHSKLQGKALLFLLLLWSLWFINFSVRAVFAPILPLIEDEFAIKHAQATSLFIFLGAGYAASLFFSGLYSGRLGYKKSIFISLTVSSLVLFLIPFVKVFSVFYVFSLVLGFVTGSYLPSAIPLITESFSEDNWGKSIAIHDSGASVAIFATPFIVLLLLHFFPWRGIFTVFAVVFLVSGVIFYFITDEVKVSRSRNTVFGNLLKRRDLWLTVILWMVASGANMGIYFIVPLYLTKELSLGMGYANSVLGISRLGGIGVAILSGFLIDRVNLRKTMYFMLLIAGIFTVLTGIAPVRFVGAFLVLQAVFITGFFPLAFVSLARMFDRELRGMATGIVLTATVISCVGLVPFLLGLSGDLISFRFGISVVGISVILSSWLIFLTTDGNGGREVSSFRGPSHVE